LVVAEPGTLTHGFGGEIVTRVVEVGFRALKTAPRRVAALDVPIPYNRSLENEALPDVEEIIKAVHSLFS
jgi:pyruvate/2-oxoglutarate/acetoin dehydrogenase E1 component